VQKNDMTTIFRVLMFALNHVHHFIFVKGVTNIVTMVMPVK